MKKIEMNDKKVQIFKKLFMAVGVLTMIMFFNSMTNGVFSSSRNLTLLMKQGSVLMIVASGILLILAQKNNDLSGGAAVYFTSVFLSMMVVNKNMNPLIAIALTLGVGIILGAINGMFIGIIGVPAFIATLASSMIFKGVGYTWTNAATIGPIPESIAFLSEGYIPKTISVIFLIFVGIVGTMIMVKNMDKSYSIISRLLNIRVLALWIGVGILIYIFSKYKGIPMAVIFSFIVAILTVVVVQRTRFGREIFLIGGNADASNLSGIKLNWRVFQTYLYMGFIYFAAGVILTARLGGATATSGNLIELDAIAAASIGGVSMAGGTGSMKGVLIGVIILSSIDNVMSLMNVSSYLQMVVKGIILLISVTVDIVSKKSGR